MQDAERRELQGDHPAGARRKDADHRELWEVHPAGSVKWCPTVLEVIEVRAKKRTGSHSLVTALRTTLEGHYPDKSLALGGTFIIQKGKAKIHIMPREFSVCPLNTNDDVNNWLKHFEVSAPLICQSVLVSRDPGLDLRVEHTHCFSHHGEGGHYYIDTTPDSVEYLGYFVPAEFVYRIDRPRETHKVGRD
ncbi:ester hydrolase C11orf54 homolog [Parambassis ranga]|uniref:Ester hydrolase C11orf54 homolog n=1 Tax=Parambassis ranga TaxID=210632 RepID=A0A6P7JMB3_9TELE|nr:ester hydrolase C11orf54 homolog [Parambassis ranga]